MSKIPKDKVQNIVPIGKIFLIKILKNLSKLVKPEKQDLKSMERVNGRLMLPK